jgi:hypothetical protein
MWTVKVPKLDIQLPDPFNDLEFAAEIKWSEHKPIILFLSHVSIVNHSTLGHK